MADSVTPYVKPRMQPSAVVPPFDIVRQMEEPEKDADRMCQPATMYQEAISEQLFLLLRTVFTHISNLIYTHRLL